MPSSDYHRRQADILMRMANAASDPERGRHLLALAAGHIKLAEADEASQSSPPIIIQEQPPDGATT